MQANPVEALQLAIDAVERIRKRQYEVTYYSSLVGASLFILVGTFADAELDSTVFYGTVLYLAAANAVFGVLFQCGLLSALTQARGELARARLALDSSYSEPRLQFVRDLPPFVYLSILPCGAAGYLAWLCVGRAGWGVVALGLV